LPYIVWNRIHHDLKDVHAIPSLKEFIGERLFMSMVVCYAIGFLMFIAGVLLSAESILMIASVFLLFSAVLYAFNVVKVNYFPPVKSIV
jgi:Zn-dependent membrane protease YugP